MRSFLHIAKLIKLKRMSQDNGYSQLELSKLLGYKNGQFISNVERGLCSVPLKMLSKISQVLNISREELKKAILKDQEETLDNYLNDSIESSSGGLTNVSGIESHLDLSIRERLINKEIVC